MHSMRATRRDILAGMGTLAVATSLPSKASAALPRNFDKLVRDTLAAFGQPGIAIAVVEGSRTALASGWGVRKLGSSEPVTDATLFNLASCSKAFTSAAVALLADEGKLRWNDRVIDHLPEFRLWDSYVTREITIRDLLVHRSGLPAYSGDLLLMPPTTYTRPEIVERLRHIQPATSFRAGYAYDNLLYLAVGELVARVSGMSFEEFIDRRIFKPLDMIDSVPAESWAKDRSNVATPHVRQGGTVRGLGEMTPIRRAMPMDASAPSGGMMSSARDLAKWLTVQVNRGVAADGQRLYSASQAATMWRGVSIIRAEGEPHPDAPNFVVYAPGWQLHDYKGHMWIWHSGGLDGSGSIVGILPEQKVGIAILSNSEEGQGVFGTLMWTLVDHYLGRPREDRLARSVKQVAATRAELAKSADEVVARPANAAPPTMPLSTYAGVYRDAWYGEVIVGEDAQGLTIDFSKSPSLKGRLEPWRGDTFRTRFADPNMEDAFLSFGLTPEGAVDEIRLKAVSPNADVSFDYKDLLLKPIRR